MRDIFEEFYENIDKAFTAVKPRIMYDGESKEQTVK